jgi:hypothetical protein
MSTPRARRRRTHLWFSFYTLALVAVGIWSVTAGQWSVALTALGIGAVFALFTRGLWRRR